MVKAKIGDLYVLGLSHENISRLMEDKPILFDLSEIGLEGKMSIMYGVTENDIKKRLTAIINRAD